MKDFVELRPIKYSYLTDYGCVDKKSKGTKKCVIKREIKGFEDYKWCQEKNETILKSQQNFKKKRTLCLQK